jgi:hypothetical protein
MAVLILVYSHQFLKQDILTENVDMQVMHTFVPAANSLST